MLAAREGVDYSPEGKGDDLPSDIITLGIDSSDNNPIQIHEWMKSPRRGKALKERAIFKMLDLCQELATLRGSKRILL